MDYDTLLEDPYQAGQEAREQAQAAWFRRQGLSADDEAQVMLIACTPNHRHPLSVEDAAELYRMAQDDYARWERDMEAHYGH
jgi:hypothetical protein